MVMVTVPGWGSRGIHLWHALAALGAIGHAESLSWAPVTTAGSSRLRLEG